MHKLYNLIFKYQDYFLGVGIFCVLTAVAFEFDNQSIELIWKDSPILSVLIIGIGLLFFALYSQIDRYKLQKLREQIRKQEQPKSEAYLNLKDSLTNRQQQVYELIIKGKSNKEIANELFIEPSTLKTHINMIYKKLKIKNRRELKHFSKRNK